MPTFYSPSRDTSPTPGLNLTCIPLTSGIPPDHCRIMTGFYNIIEIQWPPKAMADVLKRASKSAGGKRKKHENSSNDSDTLQAANDEAQRRKDEKRALKERRAERASIKKRLDEQCAINARQLQALAQKRNEYPVILFIKMNCSFTHCNSCVLAE